jgi:hypothetical protein
MTQHILYADVALFPKPIQPVQTTTVTPLAVREKCENKRKLGGGRRLKHPG